MKLRCITNSHGYEHSLVVGKEYEVIDIQDGIWCGDHYIIVRGDKGEEVAAHRHRFDISRNDCRKYVVKHHGKECDYGDNGAGTKSDDTTVNEVYHNV